MIQTQQTIAPAGLKGVVVADTRTGDVRGQEGFYHFREYSAIELARTRTFEDVTHLMLEGTLPSPEQSAALQQDLARASVLPDELVDVLPTIARSGADRAALTRLRTAISHLGALEGFGPVYAASRAQVRGDVVRLVGALPVIQAALHRLRSGADPVPGRPELGAAGNWLWMVTGREPAPEHRAALATYLTSTIDHGFSASTFAARVVTSAGSDVASACCAAIGTFAGPLHGGAPDRALDSLDEIGSADRAREWVREKVARSERIMGFGHAVYRTMDPRAAMLREIAQDLGGPLVDLAVLVEQEVIAALAELKPGRELHTNVEYYAGVVMEQCGVPREMFTPTFATARVVGWGAHILEQSGETRIFRPAARYVGPPAPAPLP
ncbi:citrate synthase/methylcitrate synthase [Ornithinimicrobium sp. F0845]|uniref:citrate/2-methylcitrate synthase n=1 Tax=Ornithinimicrobium sp. F0845 TaxID=2926412 RepID=UPI001FF127B8|nr:citrate/2-methylcitrate synthase [Ornithinimicrobium sp. F0845]MCK0111270.1 citrate synthase/methylcitrate synthase [Ornithinimicrobium sp. F0845]